MNPGPIHPTRRPPLRIAAVLAVLSLLPAFATAASFELLGSAEVDGTGIFLPQILRNTDGSPLPNLRVADSPSLSKPLILTRQQAGELATRVATELPSVSLASLSGADSIRISRRSRTVAESELRDLLTAVLQRDLVRDRGQLEIMFSRSINPITIPDGPLTLRLLESPANGVSPSFFVRFELLSGREASGQFSSSVQARLWQEVWCARRPIQRGETLNEDDFTHERRDAFTSRDALTVFPADLSAVEVNENLNPGQLLLARSVRVRPLVRRGQLIEGLILDGALSISLKVEALEDGLPNQTIRIRDPQTRRELRGRVKSDQLILVSL